MESFEALLSRLGTEDGPKAAASIVAIGPTAIPPLLEVLESGNSDAKAAASWALGELGDKHAEPALERALDDPDQDVRWFAQGALAKLRGQAEPDPKSEPSTRFHPISVSRSFSDLAGMAQRKKRQDEAVEEPGAREPIPQYLLQALDSGEPLKKWEALRGICELAPDHEAIKASLREMGDALASEDPRERSWAAVTLGMLGETAIDTLTWALDSSNPTKRMYAAWALGLTEEPNALYPLLDAVRDATAEVRAASAVALGNLADARSVGRLMSALNDAHWLVRESAAAALGAAGDPRAIPALRDLVEDDDERVRRTALDALSKLSVEDEETLTRLSPKAA